MTSMNARSMAGKELQHTARKDARNETESTNLGGKAQKGASENGQSRVDGLRLTEGIEVPREKRHQSKRWNKSTRNEVRSIAEEDSKITHGWKRKEKI